MQAFDRPPWEIIQIHGNGVIEGLGLIFLEPEKFLQKFSTQKVTLTRIRYCWGISVAH